MCVCLYTTECVCTEREKINEQTRYFDREEQTLQDMDREGTERGTFFSNFNFNFGFSANQPQRRDNISISSEELSKLNEIKVIYII